MCLNEKKGEREIDLEEIWLHANPKVTQRTSKEKKINSEGIIFKNE